MKVEVCNSPVFVRKTFRGYPNLRGGTQHYNIPEKRLHERLHENEGGRLKTPFIITHHQDKNRSPLSKQNVKLPWTDSPHT